MSHAFISISNDFADMVERTRLVSLMLSPEHASHRGLVCIRPTHVQNLYAWLKIRRFVMRWSDWRHLENAKVRAI